ncbi:SNF2 family N-terminal domain-containing protein [Corynascus novoguineensis]|uniref:SNF2 family N-terminal domain-containing protein n=1 Tax=Corynascus novoguineensis TaxID=1126955 RepID=A0AAN7HJ02_9PEZI|nr:SNF2 family N-terminal domain-containing protein [Corynascus novoguineensis]
MEFSSSPPASRRLLSLEDEDDDELSVVTQSPYFTQPTQIVERPNPQSPPAATSSPRSIVEVPASSPFRPQALQQRQGRLANLMAPAGTAFRAPSRQPLPITKTAPKREFVMISDDELDAPIYAGGDSSDDDQPSRGDIRPSSFQPKEPKTSNAATGGHPPANKVVADRRQAAKSASTSSVTSPEKSYVLQKDWVSLSSSSSQESFESLRKVSPPKQTRRRLVQGRRPRAASPSSPVLKSSQQSTKQSQLIDLVSDDDVEDGYKLPKASSQRDSSPAENDEEDAFDGRVLNYLNTCDVMQLVAIANVKEDSAKLMVSRQPFGDLDEARKVTISQKKRGKKAAKVSIGDEIVAAVRSYARSLDDIDHIIAVCESQADSLKATTSRWNIDLTGHLRRDSRSDDEKPMTPVSVEDSAKLADVPLRQPKLMEGCKMKPFQIYGLNWLHLLYQNRYGGILADDMGLGKTCQVISLICAIVEAYERNSHSTDTRPWPNVIVVPPSTLANWAAEFERFAPKLNVTLYQGSQAVRDEIAYEIQEDPSSHHVVLTSYSQLSRNDDISNLRHLRPTVAVFDEGHKMKNPKTKLYKDLLRITATWRLVLSGTPVQNNLMEMIALLQFVEPNLFQDHFENLEALFNQKVSLTAVSKGALLHSERVARARTILEPFILQRRKEQVLQDLPPKTTRVVTCKMDSVQEAIYRGYERRFRKSDSQDLNTRVKEGRDNDTNNVWIQLRKSAIHPQLFRRFFKDRDVEKMAEVLMKKVPQSELKQPRLDHLINELKALSDFELHLWCRDYKCIKSFDLPDNSWTDCAKVKALLKLVREYQTNGDRALVFTRFAKVIEILGECLASEGIEYLSLQGNTDVSARQELINEFNADESIPVFLLTTGSGGTGINLTAANKVIIFDQSDNPQDDIQAENRAHRLGQTRPVEIIRLISEGTVEELVYKACEKKLELANKVTGWSSVEMTSGEMESAVKSELLRQAVSTPPDGD